MFLTVTIWSFLIILRSMADMPTNYTQTEDIENLHLKLHKKHCGDIVTCDSRTDDPRIIYATPLPCCQPCPCLQPCTKKNICCPDVGVQNDSESHLKASLGMSTQNRMTHSGVTASIQLSTSGVESETLYQNTSILDERLDKQLQLDNSNHTDAVQSFTDLDASILGQQNSRTIAHCERPQVFHSPNYWIDSKAYMMVKFCLQGNMMIDKCYGDHVGKGISEMLPITSKLTGLTYWNKFCFICNEGDIINDTVAEVWDAILVYYRSHYNHRFFHHPDTMTDIDSQYRNGGYSNIHFVPKKSSLVHQCEAYDIATCNKTGLWETYNEHIEKVCHEGNSLPILHQINYSQNKLRFKNIACLYCNVDHSFNTDTTLSCAYYSSPPRESYSYTLTVNTGIGEMYKSTKDDRDIFSSILPLPNTGACPAGYISLLDRCRRAICPRDHYKRNNKCVPLYRTLTGLDINVKIEITPIDSVPKRLSSELMSELRTLVNTSLTKYVTLQSREISVWYGPKRSNVRDKYFMFDIFLINSSTVIDFRTSLKEIRDFYTHLNAHNRIRLSNDDVIKIQIIFNHQTIPRHGQFYDMSVSGGGSLNVLVGKTLNNSDERPAMLISDTYWCYRVPFDALSEVDIPASDVYHLKSAGIIVYYDQYDHYYKWNRALELIYVCLDLFTSQTNKEQSDKAGNDFERTESTTEGNNNNDNNNNNILALPVPVNIAIIAGCFCLCIAIALCKMRCKQAKPIVQSRTQSIPDDGTDADDGVAENGALQCIEMVEQECKPDVTNTNNTDKCMETELKPKSKYDQL